MKIVVLIKQVPDTYEERRLDPATGILDRAASDPIIDEIGERALEVALRYKDAHKGTEVVLVSMGPSSVTAALRKGLSLGADAAVHVLDDSLAGADLARTASVLAAALTKSGYDLVIAGNESTDGRGGVIPAMVAEHLGLPHLTFLDSVEISESQVSGERGTDSGSIQVHTGLPAVVSVTERTPEVRFPNFKGILSAKKKPLTVLTVGELGLGADALSGGGRSVVLSTAERPSRTAGTKVVDEGNAGVELAEFLAAGHLI
ncbi:electron transfer flavoprotein subunit beta/FixA family protein [Parafrigoribacterium mesophilum]|uniref:electron transfer flavoprotein subunit beta/FixA family protein n=1 Tax=Parafrigoribacterium mesophilum TaxID=433646 RepID=UPI0031FD0E65